MAELPPTLPKIQVIDLVIAVMFVNLRSSSESLWQQRGSVGARWSEKAGLIP